MKIRKVKEKIKKINPDTMKKIHIVLLVIAFIFCLAGIKMSQDEASKKSNDTSKISVMSIEYQESV